VGPTGGRSAEAYRSLKAVRQPLGLRLQRFGSLAERIVDRISVDRLHNRVACHEAGDRAPLDDMGQAGGRRPPPRAAAC